MGIEEYFKLGSDSPTTEATSYFIMNCILYSRLELGGDAADDRFEGDVNVYLTHLLKSFLDPAYLEGAAAYVSAYDSEVFRRLQQCQDARLKYTVYKTNADFLLVSLGVFNSDHPWPGDSKPRFDHGREGRISRGKSYYEFAFSFGQQLPANSPAVNEVLRKLAVGFEKYLYILANLRGRYFNLLSQLGQGEILHLSRSVDELKRREIIRQKQDEFLDAFLEWQSERRPRQRTRLLELAKELSELDPSFDYSTLQ